MHEKLLENYRNPWAELHKITVDFLDPLDSRLRRSTEDITRRTEYRGPLLSKFNSGEFNSHRLIGSSDVDSGYPRVGPGAYDKVS